MVLRPLPSLLLILLLSGVPAQAARVGPDGIPWPVDEPEAAALLREAPTRVRWLLRPDDPGAAFALLQEEGVELVAQLPRLGDLWILEAPAENAAAVEDSWGGLGELRRDVGGVPSLLETTRLVGVREQVWETMDLRGDIGGTVAILDSGCDTAHDDLGDPDFDDQDTPPAAGDADDWADATAAGFSPDILQRVVGWHDVSDDMPQAVGPYDYHRHGTALASAAFGGGRVSGDQRGVAPEGRFVVVKTYNFEDRWEIWASDLLLGFDWVLAHHDRYRIRACLVGASWEEDLEFSTAIAALLEVGIAVIAPAGNDGEGRMGYPALLPEVIAVGATDDQGLVAAYSATSQPDPRSLDLVAPGGSWAQEDGEIVLADNEPNDGYRGRVGTSFAAAHVAGAVSLVSQAMREGGRPWRREPSQVRWLESLLNATAVETEGAEIGAIRLPTLDRLGRDEVEGHGLLQVPAAVDAVRQMLWPGDRADFSLEAPREGRAVWAARMPVTGAARLRVQLFPPAEADFDLQLYRDGDDALTLEGFSTRAGLGLAETVELDHPDMGWYVVVAKRIQGSGEAVLLSDQFVEGETRWPLQLQATVQSSPVAHDLDGDGRLEIVTTNNVATDERGHRFYAFRSDGSNFGLFPYFDFTSSDRPGGPLTAPAVGRLGEGICLVAGSSFGDVFAVTTDAQRLFRTTIFDGLPLSSPAIWGADATARVLVGTVAGVSLLDATGAVVDDWLLPGGVASPVALGDLDQDGVEEVAVLDRNGGLHVLEIDGSELEGWPVTLGSGTLSAPVLIGQGGAPSRVAASEWRSDGSVRVHLLDAGGNPVPGYPRVLDPAGSDRMRAAGGVIPSRLARGGPVRLLCPVLHEEIDGSLRARVHRLGLDATATISEPVPLGGPVLDGGLFGLNRLVLSSARVVELTGEAEAEILFGLQLAWTEFEVAQLRRYGSVQRVISVVGDAGDPRLALDVANGHRLSPPLGMVAPVAADLDGDGRAELIVPRDNRLYLQEGRTPTRVSDHWAQERGGGRRAACYDCTTPLPVAAAPTPGASRLALRAHPNPFNPRTVLELELASAGRVELALYDARGRRLRSWTRRVEAPGIHRETLTALDGHGRPLASGVYWVVAEMGRERARRAITLLR